MKPNIIKQLRQYLERGTAPVRLVRSLPWRPDFGPRHPDQSLCWPPPSTTYRDVHTYPDAQFLAIDAGALHTISSILRGFLGHARLCPCGRNHSAFVHLSLQNNATTVSATSDNPPLFFELKHDSHGTPYMNSIVTLVLRNIDFAPACQLNHVSPTAFHPRTLQQVSRRRVCPANFLDGSSQRAAYCDCRARWPA